jgi:hypothetical protein
MYLEKYQRTGSGRKPAIRHRKIHLRLSRLSATNADAASFTGCCFSDTLFQVLRGAESGEKILFMGISADADSYLSSFTLLLFYDPYLVNLSKGKLPFIISLLIIISGIFSGYLYLRSKRDVPLRQNALPQRQGLGFPIIMWSLQDDDKGFRWVIRNQELAMPSSRKSKYCWMGRQLPMPRPHWRRC